MPYFTFYQNNSGGSFDFDEDMGITHYVIIEADDAEEANARLRKAGGYFNGCDDGADCPCCGDRWRELWANESGEETPTIYGEPASKYGAAPFSHAFMPEGKETAVHHKSGAIEWLGVIDK